MLPSHPDEEPTPQHLHFWLPASRTLRQCMLNHPFVYFVTAALAHQYKWFSHLQAVENTIKECYFLTWKLYELTFRWIQSYFLISALCLTALALQGHSWVAAWDYMAQNIYSLALYRKLSQSENNNYEYITKHHTTVCTQTGKRWVCYYFPSFFQLFFSILLFFKKLATSHLLSKATTVCRSSEC